MSANSLLTEQLKRFLVTLLVSNWSVRAWTVLEAFWGREFDCLLRKYKPFLPVKEPVENVHRHRSPGISKLLLTEHHMSSPDVPPARGSVPTSSNISSSPRMKGIVTTNDAYEAGNQIRGSPHVSSSLESCSSRRRQNLRSTEQNDLWQSLWDLDRQAGRQSQAPGSNWPKRAQEGPQHMILTATTLPSPLQDFVREGLWRLKCVICLSKPRSPITGFGVFVSVPPRGFAVHFCKKYRIPLSSTATGMSIAGGSVKNFTLSTFHTSTICEKSFPSEFVQGLSESEVLMWGDTSVICEVLLASH